MAQDPAPSPRSSSRFPAWGVVLIVAAVLAIAVAIYVRVASSPNQGTMNDNNSPSTSSQSRGTLRRLDANDVYEFTTDVFSIRFPGSWYTTEASSSWPPRLLLTASTHNASGVLDLPKGSSAVVMYINSERFEGSVTDYLAAHPVTVGSVVSSNEVTANGLLGQRREVDAVDVQEMEGSYSVAYFFSINRTLVSIIFLSLSAPAMTANNPAINTIINSLQAR